MGSISVPGTKILDAILQGPKNEKKKKKKKNDY